MSYELAVISNPRPKRRRKASKAQLAARRKFVAKFGRKRRKARKSPSTNSGVSAMAKRRKRRSPARTAKGRFVKKSHRRRSRRRSAAPVARRRRRSGGGKRRPMMGYVVGSRKVRRLKLNPRRRYRRNPLGLPSLGGITGQLKHAAFGAVGAVGLNLALSYIPLPDTFKTGWARHGVRVVGALGLGMLANKFVKGQAGRDMAAGALTIVVYDIIKAAMGQFAPEIATRLGEFEDVSISGDLDGVYSPASYLTDGVGGDLDGSPGDGDVDEMGAYMEGDLDGVAAYMT